MTKRLIAALVATVMLAGCSTQQQVVERGDTCIQIIEYSVAGLTYSTSENVLSRNNC